MFLRIFCLILLSSFAANAQPKVVVTLPALHSLVSMVMEGAGTPTILLGRQQDAHHMQLRPSQMQAVMQADLFVYYDPGFEIFVPKLAATATKHTAFLALSDVLDRQPQRESNHGWLNPDYAIAMVHYLSLELMKIDPPHAALYEKNAEKYSALIEKEATGWRRTLEDGSESRNRIVSDHQAFAGFTYYFRIAPTIAVEDPGGEISLRRLKEVEKEPVTCLIATHGSSAIMQRLAQEMHVKLHLNLNPLGTLYIPGTRLYFNLMNDLVREFEECLF